MSPKRYAGRRKESGIASPQQSADAREAALTRWGKNTLPPDEPGEEWRPVPSYPGYQASSRGRVRSAYMILEGGHRNKFGHLYLAPSVNGVQRAEAAHRMVCEAFHGPCPPKHECRHLDGDARNNEPANLAWGTKLQNQRDRIAHGTSNTGERNGRAKITADLVREIYRRAQTGERYKKIAEALDVTTGQVGLIAGGFRWNDITGVPKKERKGRAQRPDIAQEN